MPTNNQRRAASRRQLQNQLQRRQLQEQRRRRNTLITSIVGTVVIIAIVVGFVVATTGEDKKTPAAASTSPTASTSASATHTPGVCDFVSSGTSTRKVSVPAKNAPTTGTANVSVTTNLGKMTFKLNRAAAPCTVASFVSLVQQKYFDNTTCHRLVTSVIYVLQCGDPTGTGTGTPGYSVPDEATGAETYPAGTIAMARTSSPNSGGSQFFIVYKDSPALQQQLGAQQYTVFGTVTSGMNVVNEVAAKGSDDSNGSGDGKPKLKIELEKLTAA